MQQSYDYISLSLSEKIPLYCMQKGRPFRIESYKIEINLSPPLLRPPACAVSLWVSGDRGPRFGPPGWRWVRGAGA